VLRGGEVLKEPSVRERRRSFLFVFLWGGVCCCCCCAGVGGTGTGGRGGEETAGFVEEETEVKKVESVSKE
jgi:hypothetical protein